MRVNSETSLRVAANTFNRFKGDWTEVHRSGKVNADGILVIGGDASKPARRKATKPKG